MGDKLFILAVKGLRNPLPNVKCTPGACQDGTMAEGNPPGDIILAGNQRMQLSRGLSGDVIQDAQY